LKIRHNQVLGYFVETPSGGAAALMQPPHDALFRHRQTMASAVRFSTVELAELDTRIAQAGERALGLELELFETLRGAVCARREAVSPTDRRTMSAKPAARRASDRPSKL